MSDSPLGLLSALVGWYFSFAISDETEGVVKTEQGSVAYLRYGLWLNLWKWSHSPWKAMVVTMVWSLCVLFGTIVCLLVVDMMFDVWSTAPILFWSFVVTMVVMFLPGPWRSHHVRQICRDPHMAVLLRAALEVLAPFADLEQPVDLSYGVTTQLWWWSCGKVARWRPSWSVTRTITTTHCAWRPLCLACMMGRARCWPR